MIFITLFRTNIQLMFVRGKIFIKIIENNALLIYVKNVYIIDYLQYEYYKNSLKRNRRF